MTATPDAVVVGAGPNGLAAAVTLARSGLSVTVYEAERTIGGGARTAESTLPGFRHDVCSAVHPMAVASGFFRRFELERRIEFLTPEISYAHPLDGGRAAIAWRDLDRTAADLGVDGPAWRRVFGPLAHHAQQVARLTGSSLLRVPANPVTTARFGLRALDLGGPFAERKFAFEEAAALFAGLGGHAISPLQTVSTAAAALALGTHGHARGWPVPRGGSQSIVDALAADLISHGGTIITEARIDTLAQLPRARAVILDLTPRAALALAGDRLPRGYRRALAAFHYGNAAAKVDFALAGPVPWTNARAREAVTLHLGGTRAEIRAAEATVAAGRHSENPYVLVSQPSLIDATRAPEGHHVLWAYTHVPHGSALDQTEAITRQIERFAPGFRDLVLASSSRTATDLETHNANYVGGDIASGAVDLRQLVRRPVLSTEPWRMPAPGLYLGSASTPPGPAVHGLAGYYAARSALRHEFGLDEMPYLGL